jgi:hypothetical protein
MPAETALLDPLAEWFRTTLGVHHRLLIHEEPQGRGGRRVDILVVFARSGKEQVDQALVVSVEIEVSSKAAIHDRKNGVSQLRKYPGHARYLAIPRTVAVRWEAREIPFRCNASGFGLLVVDLQAGATECVVKPNWSEPPHGLRYYPAAMRRWTALCRTDRVYRRISHGKILEEE